LARQSVLAQLQASAHPRYRALLQDELTDLDSKLSRLK
jgi:acyl-CoA hydrolase